MNAVIQENPISQLEELVVEDFQPESGDPEEMCEILLTGTTDAPYKELEERRR